MTASRSTSAPKGHPTPRRTERQQGRAQHKGVSATVQWLLVAAVIVAGLVVGGLLWGDSNSDNPRRITPIGGHG
jgi:hypothetical protein